MKYYVEFILTSKNRVPWLVVEIHPESPTKSVLDRKVAGLFLRWNSGASFVGLRFMWSLGALHSEAPCAWLKALLEILNNSERAVWQFHFALDP